MMLYRGMDRTALDAAYNNSAAVSNSAAFMADYRARSDRLRIAMPRYVDLRYGELPRNRIDYFPAERPGPVLVFIHGGYWQMRAKEDFSVLAQGPLAHGIHVAFAGYTLAPDLLLGGIVDEIRAAIRWLAAQVGEYGGDTARMYVSGWSAGAHLAAMTLDEEALRGGLAISGIYDLEPMTLCYINDKLRLTPHDVDALSPLRHVASAPKQLIVACGGGELAELQRQSKEFADARAAAGLPGQFVRLPGCNHFTILDELTDPAGALARLAKDLVFS